jgi:acetyltransferase
MSEVLAKQPRPSGSRLTIVSNAGGPAVLATDALIRGGGHLSDISPETMEKLNGFLPSAWSHGNPIDILGDASPERFAKALEVAAADPGSDGVLVVLTPQAMTDPTRTAEVLRPYARLRGKPVIASWMGGDEVEAGAALLSAAGIPTFPYPDTAVEMFNYLWRFSDTLRSIYETPSLPRDEEDTIDRGRAESLIAGVRASGRTLLTEVESKDVLAAYGIPIAETRIAEDEAAAVAAAEAIGYPVVVKLYSHAVSHKTDVGGVQLNLADGDAVRRAYRSIREAVVAARDASAFEGVTVQPMINYTGYELILGSSVDPQFGPVLLFGTGGQLVELLGDRALGLPPLNTTLARRMIERTRVYTALRGVRGRRPIDMDALEQLLVRFSLLVAEQRWIAELDINPLLASPEQLVALDARIVLHDPSVTAEQLPRLAIRPYPRRYAGTWTASDGTQLVLRPIRPEDEPLMVRFHAGLSEQTVYQRYFQALGLDRRTAHERLTRICFNDYDREIALVAEREGDAGPEIVGVGRLSRLHARNEAEFAILISDGFQGRGLGTELLRRLVEIGREENMDRIVAEILENNMGMQRAAIKNGFRLHRSPELGEVDALIDLRESSRSPVATQSQ